MSQQTPNGLKNMELRHRERKDIALNEVKVHVSSTTCQCKEEL